MNKFEIQSPANIEAVNCITQKLGVYNRETYGPSGRESFSITQSKNGQLIAGASGFTQWGWMYIQILWVESQFRGQGLGQQLLEEAEKLAVKKCCTKVNLDTFGDENKNFYSKNDYQIFGMLENYPPGFNKYFLFKELKQANKP